MMTVLIDGPDSKSLKTRVRRTEVLPSCPVAGPANAAYHGSKRDP